MSLSFFGFAAASDEGPREFAVDAEKYFPKSAIDDDRYQAYLDQRGIGKQWTAYLRQRVAELEPITAVALSDPTPQVVVSR